MKKSAVILCASLGLIFSSPLYAGWSLRDGGEAVKVKKTGMTVTPTTDWNRTSSRPGKKAEQWTLDGLSLNNLSFFGNIETGDTLFRNRNKKTQPLPKFDSEMLIPDVVQWFEANHRIVSGTALFEIGSIAPRQFAGNPGFQFTYEFVVDADEVPRKGIAVGAMVDRKLYLISYAGPEIHFFDHSKDEFEKIVDSVSISSK